MLRVFSPSWVWLPKHFLDLGHLSDVSKVLPSDAQPWPRSVHESHGVSQRVGRQSSLLLTIARLRTSLLRRTCGTMLVERPLLALCGRRVREFFWEVFFSQFCLFFCRGEEEVPCFFFAGLFVALGVCCGRVLRVPHSCSLLHDCELPCCVGLVTQCSSGDQVLARCGFWFKWARQNALPSTLLGITMSSMAGGTRISTLCTALRS